MTTLRPSRQTFLIFGAIYLPMALFGLQLIAKGDFGGIVLLLLGGALTIGPFLCYRVIWEDKALTYRGLVYTRTVQFSDIRTFKIHGPKAGDRYGPTVGLSIYLKKQSKPAMTINLKPFSTPDVERLEKRLSDALNR